MDVFRPDDRQWLTQRVARHPAARRRAGVAAACARAVDQLLRRAVQRPHRRRRLPEPAVADHDRQRLHDQRLPGVQSARRQHQLLCARRRRVADHLRQRRAHRADVVQQQRVHEHKIWFTNSSSSGIHDELPRPASSPSRRSTRTARARLATVGVPFTYTLTIPVLFDPNAAIVVDDQGSQNDLHGVTVWDDLNADGRRSDVREPHGSLARAAACRCTHTFSNVNGLLTFEIDDPGIDVPAGEQFIIELTVVLDDTPANAPGTQFINTAKWDFGRLIEGMFYEPLPGEWGISEPMTIAAPAAHRHEDRAHDARPHAEPRPMGPVRHRRAQHRPDAGVGRHDPRPPARRPDGRHVRSDARDPERAGVRGRRRHAGARQRAARRGHRLHARATATRRSAS